jgi:hypothetical protein
MYLYLVQQLARQRDDDINRAVKYAHHRRQLRRRNRHPRGGVEVARSVATHSSCRGHQLTRTES